MSGAPITCRHCGARSDMDPIEAFRRIVRCNNCQIDIQTGGQWTGKGHGIKKALEERWGATHVKVAMARAAEEKNLSKKFVGEA